MKISVHTPRVSVGKRFTTATGPHTHTGLTTTQCCLPPHQWSHRKTRQLLLSAFVRTWPANRSRCVSVCVCKSIRIWLNQQAHPLLSTAFQRDPRIRSVFISKQSIKETGSGSVSWDQIDVVQIQEDSGPLGSVGHAFTKRSGSINTLKGQYIMLLFASSQCWPKCWWHHNLFIFKNQSVFQVLIYHIYWSQPLKFEDWLIVYVVNLIMRKIIHYRPYFTILELKATETLNNLACESTKCFQLAVGCYFSILHGIAVMLQ